MESKIDGFEGEEVLLNFLVQTADGTYALIEQSSIPYARMEVQTETAVFSEQDYFYSFG
jgi:hypothetical protein